MSELRVPVDDHAAVLDHPDRIGDLAGFKTVMSMKLARTVKSPSFCELPLSGSAMANT